jgi:hypothetical protein
VKFLNIVLLAAVSVGSLAQAKEGASVGDVRLMLKTSSLPTLNLDLTRAEQSELNAIPFRFFSSIEMKRRLQPAIENLVLDERLGAPLKFNPGMSAFEHRTAMKNYRYSVCEQSLALLKTTDFKTKQVLTGDVAFLNEMQGMSPRILQPADESAKISPALEQKLISKVNAQLASASAQSKSESPSKIFGPLVAIDSFGGEHYRLHFKNLAAEVSLPMMLSFMSGQDAGFVRVLDCASNRLDRLMVDRKIHDKYWGMSPVRLAHTLKQKSVDAAQANKLMNALNASQLKVLTDVLVQLDAAAILSPDQFTQRNKAMLAKTQGPKAIDDHGASAAHVEFLQFLNRELGDFRDTKRSVNLLRREANL